MTFSTAVKIRNPVKVLEDEADGFGADAVEFSGAEIGDVLSVEPDFAAGGVSRHPMRLTQVLLPEPEGPITRDPLARRDGERDVVERINQSVPAIIFLPLWRDNSW